MDAPAKHRSRTAGPQVVAPRPFRDLRWAVRTHHRTNADRRWLRTAIAGSRRRPDRAQREALCKLLLTTGSVVHRLDVPGAEQNGGRYLRRIEQADALRDVLVEGAGLIVVDGGWIGLEVLAAARVCGAADAEEHVVCGRLVAHLDLYRVGLAGTGR